MPRGNHDIGKVGESETWEFLAKHGYIRPSKEQRISIKDYYSSINIDIDKSGFDVIQKKDIDFIGSQEIQLFEVKTTGRSRGKSITADFIGLGFTLTEKEFNNSNKLDKRFKFIFVNLASESMRIFDIDDFFNENKANIYKTWSVFIKKSI